MTDSTAELLADCLDAIRAGRKTVEACLAEHPAEAETLRPLICVALAIAPPPALSDVTADPAFRARARATLLEALAAERSPVHGAHRWQRWSRAAIARPRFATRMLLPLTALLGAVLLLAAGGGVVLAAQSALPGDALYPVKTSLEQLRIQLATTDDDRARVLLDLAGRRADEARQAAKEGRRDAVNAAADAYVRDVSDARAHLTRAEATGEDVNALSEQLASKLDRQQVKLEEAAARAPEDAKPAVDAALAAGAVPLPAGKRGSAPPAGTAAPTPESGEEQIATPAPTETATLAPVVTSSATSSPEPDRSPSGSNATASTRQSRPIAAPPVAAPTAPDDAGSHVAQPAAAPPVAAPAPATSAGRGDGDQAAHGTSDGDSSNGSDVTANGGNGSNSDQGGARTDAANGSGHGQQNGQGQGTDRGDARANPSETPPRQAPTTAPPTAPPPTVVPPTAAPATVLPTANAGQGTNGGRGSGQGDGNGRGNGSGNPTPQPTPQPTPRPSDQQTSDTSQPAGPSQHGPDQGDGHGSGQGNGQGSGAASGNGQGSGQGSRQDGGPAPTQTPKPGHGNGGGSNGGDD